MEFSLGILIGVVGLALLLWALVRPRKGDEPHCRRCGFNLVGLTNPKACPECGSDTRKWRSTVRGHRPSPKKAVVWCVGLLLVSGALIGLDRMNRTGFFPLTKYKAAFMLQAEAYLLGDLRASMATEELVARIGKGTFGVGAQDRLVATALTRHAQTWRAFPDAQWIVITQAMARNELSFEQIKRVWDDCIVDARLVEAGKNGGAGPFMPGEAVLFVTGYDTRAGTMGTVGMRDVGFALDTAMSINFENSDDEMSQNARIATRGAIVQRNPLKPNGERHRDLTSIRTSLPSGIGVHRGVVEYEIAFASEIVAKT